MSLNNESAIPTKNNECVLHRCIEGEVVVVFIDVHLLDFV